MSRGARQPPPILKRLSQPSDTSCQEEQDYILPCFGSSSYIVRCQCVFYKAFVNMLKPFVGIIRWEEPRASNMGACQYMQSGTVVLKQTMPENRRATRDACVNHKFDGCFSFSFCVCIILFTDSGRQKTPYPHVAVESES